MGIIREWLRWLLCEHDWRDKTEFVQLYTRLKDNKEYEVGRVYVKECAKCHRIWKQSVHL